MDEDEMVDTWRSLFMVALPVRSSFSGGFDLQADHWHMGATG
jgi:hypothetical protein